MRSSSAITTSTVILIILLVLIYVPVFTANNDYHEAKVSVVYEKYLLNQDTFTFNFYAEGEYIILFEFPSGYKHAKDELYPSDFMMNPKPGQTEQVKVDRIDAVKVTIIRNDVRESHLFVWPK